MNFEGFISELRNDTMDCQNDEKEEIHEYEVVRALNVANYCAYQNIADIFLGCASINLVNTFVKQNGANLNYEFRRHLRRILLAIWELKDKRIRVCIEQKGINILIIEICGFQFSFKNEKESAIVKKIEKGRYFKWDGIRKQQCASTIFLSAQCNDFISNLTTAGNDLLALLDREEDNYDKGYYRFINGKLIKIGNQVVPDHSNDDAYLINYIRINLLEHKNRPALFVGTFVKVWPKHVTFIRIRPLIGSIQTTVICDHINIFRETIEKFISVDSLIKYKKYVIAGYCRKYPNSDRMGVALADDLGGCPIHDFEHFKDFPTDLLDKCHRFNIENYFAFKNRHFKL